MEFIAKFDKSVVYRISYKMYAGSHNESDYTEASKCWGSFGMASLKKLEKIQTYYNVHLS